MIKRFIKIAILLCFFPVLATAQSFEDYKRQQQAKYNSYVQQKTEEFRAYRDRVNAEYADFMRRSWTREEVQPAMPLPKRPEPPKPVVKNPVVIPEFEPIPFEDIVIPKVPDFKKPQPIIPLDELEQLGKNVPDKPLEDVKPQKEDKPTENVKPEEFAFKWCGKTWNVPLDNQHRFRLKSVSEGNVADAWKILSEAKYAGVVAACLKIRNVYQLPDWGYLYFLESMANAFFPGKINEARLLEMFILSQSGYQVRIARSNGQLYLLVPSSGDIYEYSYLIKGGRKFYVVDKASEHGSFSVFERDFPRAQPFTWQMSRLPMLAGAEQRRTLHGKQFPEVQSTVAVSKNLMDFMDAYPRCNDWNSYASASLSQQAKDGLYPALRQSIEGKTKREAVDILLDFVQTAFDYKTDYEQFGKERPLFGDETLFYPYCDCEDRSILFSILVRELAGLDVVLLNYPQHLATAVCFNENVEGDYFVLDGKRYVVCDPTYIGSHVGEAMPSLKNTKATIIKL